MPIKIKTNLSLEMSEKYLKVILQITVNGTYLARKFPSYFLIFSLIISKNTTIKDTFLLRNNTIRQNIKAHLDNALVNFLF